MIAAIETPRLRLVPMSLEFLERGLAGERAAAERALGLAPDEAWWDETALMALRANQLRADPTLGAWLLRAVVAARLGFRQVGEARDESGVELVLLRENADPGAHLDLWRRGLGVVPDRICAQRGLETLVLADNDLVTLPASLGALQDLRVLDLGHNALRSVPATLGELAGRLDFLYLHDNCLRELPAALGRLGRRAGC